MDDTCKFKPCPLGIEVGFISCYWWSNTGCTYPTPDEIKQLEDLKAMREASVKNGNSYQ